MSEVTRYTTTGTAFGPALIECPKGDWVSYSDYYYLEAEVKRLRAQAAIPLPTDTGLNGALAFAIDAIVNQKKESK